MHPPRPPEQVGDPLVPPLDLSSTYRFESVDEFAAATAAKVGEGYVYTRWANPTVDAFELAVADLEGAPAAEATASGMAAISGVCLALCGPGDRIVSARQLYGGTHSLFADVLPRWGIETTLCDVDDHGAIERALPGAALLYCETLGNPRITVADLPALARLAAGAGVPLVVDNTFAGPTLCRPLEHGASLVVHSATKFLGGHHDLVGGVVCGTAALVEKVAALARDLGPTMSPFTAWLALRGLATLPLRVERSSRSARAVAEALSSHPEIADVWYPALPGSPDRPLADRLLGGAGGGTIGFVPHGGRDRARRLLQEVRLVARAASLGGTHSLIVESAGVTHTQLGPDQLAAAGISEGSCRLSVGLEDPEDLIADLEGALERSA